MNVVCNNCGGIFEHTEPKCPYCGMIFEPGAEMEYSSKMEGIRKNLDDVDDLVVSNFKSELKRFLVTFLVSMSVIMLLVGIVVIGRIQSRKREREAMVQEMSDRLDRISMFSQTTDAWNKLYEEGRYKEMYEKVSAEKTLFTKETCNWVHYYFYATYVDYLLVGNRLQSLESTGILSEYDYSQLLNSLFNIYADLYNNEYYAISEEEREILTGFYEEVKQEYMEKCNVSPEEYEAIRERVAGDGVTYVSILDCEQVAKERVGE